MTQGTKKVALNEGNTPDGVMYYNGQYSEIVTPLMVDLSDIFDDHIILYLTHYFKKETKISVNIGTSDKMHNVTGTIVSIKEKDKGYEADLEVDFIPDGLIKDLEEVLALGTILQEDGWE